MKAYVINLEKDTDRRRAMERELTGTPFADVEFVKAVDGRLMSERELKEAFDYEKFAMRHIGRPQPGEVGCALSHRTVWQKIAKGDTPAVVFEDDVTFEGSWDDILSFALPWLDSERPRTLLMPRHFFYARLRRAIGEGKVARPIQGFGAECYMMNAVAARLLVALGRPSFIADEWDYFRSCGLDLLAFIPHPVNINTRFDSNIVSRQLWCYDYDGAVQAVTNTPVLFDSIKIAFRAFLRDLHIFGQYIKAPLNK